MTDGVPLPERPSDRPRPQQSGAAAARRWGTPLGLRLTFSGLSLALTAISIPVGLSTRSVALAVIAPLMVGAATGMLCMRYWRSGLTLTADEVIIQNVFTHYRVPLTHVVRASAGAYGVSVFTRDGNMLSASAVQKDRLANMTGRVTRADQVANAITEAAEAAGSPTGVWRPSPEWLSGQALGLAGLGAAMVAGYLLVGGSSGSRGESLGALGVILLIGGAAWWLWMRVKR